MKKLLVFGLLLTACGRDGTNGLNGQPGEPGTQIRIIQFCPGATSYPSTFLEQGFCISNKIYAVYSINSGFLTEVPPGAYSSNAVNSRCNFIVLPNCEIQN